jgi:hypothetical protein
MNRQRYGSKGHVSCHQLEGVPLGRGKHLVLHGKGYEEFAIGFDRVRYFGAGSDALACVATNIKPER